MEHGDVVTLFHEFGHLRAPRARRRPAVGAVLGRRHRVGLRRGAVADARGVGLGRRRPAHVRRRRRRHADPAPTWSTRMRAAKDFGKGSSSRTQLFYAAISLRAAPRPPGRPHRRGAGPAGAATPCSTSLAGHALPGLVRPPRRVHVGLLHLHVEPGDREGPVLRVRPGRPVRARTSPTATATGCSPAAAPRDAADLVADFLGRPFAFDAFAAWLDRAPVPVSR